MGRVAVLVDAGYLFKAGGQLIASRNIGREGVVLDPEAAVDQLGAVAQEITGRELLRVYWYDAAPRDSSAPHREVAEIHDLKLRLGHLNSAGQQKGVDALIITDMMTLARNRACDDFVLLSGDADLVAGVLQAQEHGVRVHLLGITPARQNQAPTLRYEADTCHEWNARAVSALLRLATPEEVAERKKRPSRRRSDRVAVSQANGDARPSRIKPVGDAPTENLPEPALRSVAESVALELSAEDRASVASGDRPGLVPGPIDRKLLGTARKSLDAMLSESDKRALRHFLYERCATPS
jgi:uncharacterized LabA/DUF88 family protein